MSEFDGETTKLLALYSVCFGRYQVNTQLQWQAAAFVLSGEGALLAGVLATTKVVSLLLGITTGIFGCVGVVLMQRIELTEWWDREMLDAFEHQLLPSMPGFHLKHGVNLPKRMAGSAAQAKRLRNPVRRAEWVLVRFGHPSVLVLVLVAIFGMMAFGVGISHLMT